MLEFELLELRLMFFSEFYIKIKFGGVILIVILNIYSYYLSDIELYFDMVMLIIRGEIIFVSVRREGVI